MAELLEDVGGVRVALAGVGLSCSQMTVDERNRSVVDNQSSCDSSLELCMNIKRTEVMINMGSEKHRQPNCQ